MANQTVVVSVLADTKKFTAGFKQLSNDPGLTKLGEIGAKLGTALKVGAAAGVAALGALAVSSTKAAGNLEQSIGAIDTVFKGSADQMHEWAKSAAQDVGLARNEFNELGTLIGTQLKNGGTAMEDLAPKTQSLITLGADLSSMYGGTTKEAVEALSSALKGERDPIEKYGVSLTQAAIDAKAAELGFQKVGGALSAEATQAATVALIMEQTADAHGNFAAEADTLQGKQQRLTAAWENMQATIGEYLLPVVSEFVGMLNEQMGPALETVRTVMEQHVAPAFAQLGDFITNEVMPAFDQVAGWVTENKDALGTLAAVIGGAAAAYALWTGAITAWQAVTTAAAVVQAVFNAVLNANPIMLVVTAVAALVAGLVYFFTQTEAGRAAWETFTTALKVAWDAVVTWFNTTLDQVKTWFSNAGTSVTNAWTAVSDWFAGLPAKIGGFFSGAASLLLSKGKEILDGLKRGAENGWNTVASFVGGIPGKITNALGNAGTWLLDTGRNVLMGLWNGINDKIGWVKNKIAGIGASIINAAKNVFGIHSPSRVFAEIGGQLVAGLEQGLGQTGSLQSTVTGLGDLVTNSFDATLGPPGARAGTYYSFNGLSFSSANDEEARVLADFVAFARRKARAGV